MKSLLLPRAVNEAMEATGSATPEELRDNVNLLLVAVADMDEAMTNSVALPLGGPYPRDFTRTVCAQLQKGCCK